MIEAQTLHEIAEEIGSQTLSEPLIADLRSKYAGVHFTYCMDDDIPNHQPVLERMGFNLYLVDGRDHCMCITESHQNATGIVVAEIIPE
jgi:hypothetical protein